VKSTHNTELAQHLFYAFFAYRVEGVVCVVFTHEKKFSAQEIRGGVESEKKSGVKQNKHGKP
jgi:hypothetical protein